MNDLMKHVFITLPVVSFLSTSLQCLSFCQPGSHARIFVAGAGRMLASIRLLSRATWRPYSVSSSVGLVSACRFGLQCAAAADDERLSVRDSVVPRAVVHGRQVESGRTWRRRMEADGTPLLHGRVALGKESLKGVYASPFLSTVRSLVRQGAFADARDRILAESDAPRVELQASVRSLLKEAGRRREGKAVNDGVQLITDLGLKLDEVMLAALLGYHGAVGNLDRMRELMASVGTVDSEVKELNGVHYGVAVRSLAHSGLDEEVLQMFDRMKAEGIRPNRIMVHSFCEGLFRNGKWKRVREVMDGASRMGLSWNEVTFSTLISGYAKAGEWMEVLRVFDDVSCGLRGGRSVRTARRALLKEGGDADAILAVSERFRLRPLWGSLRVRDFNHILHAFAMMPGAPIPAAVVHSLLGGLAAGASALGLPRAPTMSVPWDIVPGRTAALNLPAYPAGACLLPIVRAMLLQRGGSTLRSRGQSRGNVVRPPFPDLVTSTTVTSSLVQQELWTQLEEVLVLLRGAFDDAPHVYAPWIGGTPDQEQLPKRAAHARRAAQRGVDKKQALLPGFVFPVSSLFGGLVKVLKREAAHMDTLEDRLAHTIPSALHLTCDRAQMPLEGFMGAILRAQREAPSDAELTRIVQHLVGAIEKGVRISRLEGTQTFNKAGYLLAQALQRSAADVPHMRRLVHIAIRTLPSAATA